MHREHHCNRLLSGWQQIKLVSVYSRLDEYQNRLGCTLGCTSLLSCRFQVRFLAGSPPTKSPPKWRAVVYQAGGPASAIARQSRRIRHSSCATLARVASVASSISLPVTWYMVLILAPSVVVCSTTHRLNPFCTSLVSFTLTPYALSALSFFGLYSTSSRLIGSVTPLASSTS